MFEATIYAKRRETLRHGVKGGLVLLLGNGESPANYTDNTYRFRQDSTFLYYFGLSMPGFAGVIDTESGEECLYGNDVDIDDIIWMGPQPKVKELAETVGVKCSRPFAELAGVLREAISKGRKIHFLPPYRYRNMLLLEELLGIRAVLLPTHASVELIKAVVAMRLVKEACEIEEITKACNIGYEMHTTAMRRCRSGVKEQEIAGTIEGIAAAYGSMISFPVILSQHGETLHNHSHDALLQKGRMMLTDAGAENNMNYCSDFTRTVPVDGKFTSRQKEVYQVVVDCNQKALEISRPGVPYMTVHTEVCKVLAAGLKALGLMKGNVEEAVAAGAHALFMPHGLGHAMGLDVHDMEDLGQIYVGYDDEIRPSTQFGTSSVRMGKRLKPGYVVTDEPGCYFIPALIDQWRAGGMHKEFLNYDKIETYKDFGGIRLEDDVLITENGCRTLGDRRIPITVAEVEEIMG